MANDENLRRGNKPGTSDKKIELRPAKGGGFLMPPGSQPGDQARLMEGHRVNEEVKKAVIEDPAASLDQIHAYLTALTVKLFKKAERAGKPPDRLTMDVLKEFRQTMEAVNDERRARGAVAQAEDFFATLDSRVAEATARMADGPQPPVSLPA